MDKGLRSIQETRELFRQAEQARRALVGMNQEQLDEMTAAIAVAVGEHAWQLVDMATEEMSFGKEEDKELKNHFTATTPYEIIRDKKTHGTLAESREKHTIDIGVPVSTVAGLVPSTNPISTVIYKSMIRTRTGNSIIFSPHPSAVNCTLETVNVVCRAVGGVGVPAGSISCATTPTLEVTNALVRHDDTRLALIIGGRAVVKAVYPSGTTIIGMGTGNGPAYIHHTVGVRLVVRRTLDSKTLDSGTICTSEQSIVVERRTERAVTVELRTQGAYLPDDEKHRFPPELTLCSNGTMNSVIVGKSMEMVARLAGLTRVPPTVRVLVAQETGVGSGYPYFDEKLGLILVYYVEDSEETMFRRCAEILEWGGAGHTFAIHTEGADTVKHFVAAVPASCVLVNTLTALGGTGITTCLSPVSTLGCGVAGDSSSFNNIGFLDLINIKRAAWGVKRLGELRGNRPATGHTPCTMDESLSDELVNRIIGRLSI